MSTLFFDNSSLEEPLDTTRSGPRLSLLLSLFLFVLAGFHTARSDTLRTQTISLEKGWNAVFLEVHPLDPDPAVLFTGTPIDIIATYYAPNSSAQFITDPGADLFKLAGWGVWYAEDRPDAFLKTLGAVYGQRAYLVHAKSDHTWAVPGNVVPPEVRWQPNSYNLVGFSVDRQAAPTFAQFFSGSKAHRQNRIYRLVDGSWQRVSEPDRETMRSGEAFWIYCEGNSKYQGPLRAETTTRRGVLLKSGPDVLTLRNDSDHPVTSQLEHLVSGSNPVPLSIVVRALVDETAPIQSIPVPKPAGSWTQSLPPLEAGAALGVPLEARYQDMRSFRHSSLVKITTDLGTEIWIPVVGIREDLKER